jgi:hypothetical protein
MSPVEALTGDPIVLEARRRFDRVAEWESIWRQRAIEDIRFTYGDSDNGYQWPNEIRNARDTTARPCLTMNLINRHNKMISNQARQNKSTVKYIGMGNGATQDMANCYRDIHRHIEYRSQAQSAYTVARDFAVACGLGWWRIGTDYEASDGIEAFNQELVVLPVGDPLSIYMDPDIKQKSGSDAMWAFVFDDLAEEEFEEAYPGIAKKRLAVGTQPLGLGTISGDWITKHKIRVCEYFRRVAVEGELVSFVHLGQRHAVRRDKLSKLIEDASRRNALLADPQTRIREVVDYDVEWYLIAGEERIDETKWVGSHIPLCRVVGEETTIEGVLDRRGHTRWMKDAQRMLNYNYSAQVEFAALQSKAPWVVAVKAIEEFETIWNTANVQNPAVLPFNHVDPEGDPSVPIPPPIRPEPPSPAPAYADGISQALNMLMFTSGQFQNEMGMMGNERTGAAINARQRQSATANFHFQDNYEDALIYEGKIFLECIPLLYDTRRVKQIIADDGIEYELEIDPSLRQGYLEHQARDGKIIRRSLNPLVGRFDVAASVGPAFGSKREEALESLTTIITQAPGLTALLGDILFKNMDFEGAEEAAMRLRRMVPPQALGQGPTPNEQMLTQQLGVLSQALQKSMEKQAKDQVKLVGKDQLRDIEAYDAVTKRITAEQKLIPSDADGLRAMVHQLVKEALSTSIGQVMEENKPDEAEQSGKPPLPEPPVPGAMQGGDGEWYLTDPTRRGKYLHVASLAQFHRKPGIAPAAPISAPPPVTTPRQAPDGKFYIQHPHTGKFYRVDRANSNSNSSAKPNGKH